MNPTKLKQDKHVDTEHSVVVTREEEGEMGEGDRNWILGGKHTVKYSEIKMQYCAHETYHVINLRYLHKNKSPKLKKKLLSLPRRVILRMKWTKYIPIC